MYIITHNIKFDSIRHLVTDIILYNRSSIDSIYMYIYKRTLGKVETFQHSCILYITEDK